MKTNVAVVSGFSHNNIGLEKINIIWFKKHNSIRNNCQGFKV